MKCLRAAFKQRRCLFHTLRNLDAKRTAFLAAFAADAFAGMVFQREIMLPQGERHFRLHHGKVVMSGNLNEIKKERGRENLTVKADKPIADIAAQCGLTLVEETPNGSSFKVKSEEDAGKMLRTMLDNGINVIKFDLREPSLHELFVEKCGGDVNEG